MKFFYTLLLLLTFNVCFSQFAVVNNIKKLIAVDKKLFYTKEFEKKSFMFSMALVINDNGHVDSVAHSKGEIFSTKLIDAKRIIANLKKDKKTFAAYKGQLLFIAVKLKRDDDDDGRLKVTDEIGTLYSHLLENVEKKRKITYIEPMLIVI